MSTYHQWRVAADKGEVKRVTWVCGDQRVLVEEVVDTVRARVGASVLNYQTFTAGTDPDREFWAAAHQFPLEAGANRFILVRNAERISRWQPLDGWLAATRQLVGVYLLFVSGEPDFAYQMVDGRKAGLKPHLETIKNRGRIVRCSMPHELDLVAWVRRRVPLDEEMARYLLRRTGADLATVAGTCTKLALLPGNPGPVTIDALCAEAPTDTFVNALLNLRKRDALLAAPSVSDKDYGRTVSVLDQRLDLLAALWRATRAGRAAREITGWPTFLVRQYLPAAKHYDPDRCVYSRRVLAVCDEALRGGARTGWLEALVALW